MSASFSARRPRPELADRQRRDRLERRDEPLQALRIEAAGAAADQLERHRVDARQAGELVGRDPRQSRKNAGRQVVVDVAERRDDDVEVVEQPLGGGRRRLSAFRVVGERGIDALAASARAGAAASGARGCCRAGAKKQ